MLSFRVRRTFMLRFRYLYPELDTNALRPGAFRPRRPQALSSCRFSSAPGTYSARNASVGCTESARLVGTTHARRHTPKISTAYPTSSATRDAVTTPVLADAILARRDAAVDVPKPDGAVLRLPVVNGRLATTAETVVDGLLYANGLAIDERSGHLYVAETTGDRVLRYRVDLTSGRVSERSVFVDVAGDNLELDDAGRLWVALPLDNALVVVDTRTGHRDTVFQLQSAAQQAQSAEFNRRGTTGTSRLELLTPDLWTPLPGFVTGVILSNGAGPVYITGLGDALIRLAR
jgi:hypothetical protein